MVLTGRFVRHLVVSVRLLVISLGVGAVYMVRPVVVSPQFGLCPLRTGVSLSSVGMFTLNPDNEECEESIIQRRDLKPGAGRSTAH